MPPIADSIVRPPIVPTKPPTGPLPLQFRHRTVGAGSDDLINVMFPCYWTRLDHPALNGNPSAILTVTPVGRIEVNDQTNTATLIHNPHQVDVLYREDDAHWYIYTLGLEPMEINADFHVEIDTESQAV